MGGKRCNERFALSRFQFRDASLMQHHAAEQLHVEVPHSDGSHRSLAHGRKGLAHEIVERFALVQTFTETRRLAAQLLVAHFLHLGLKRVDAGDVGAEFFQPTFAAVAEQCIDQTHAGLLSSFGSPQK